MSKSKKPKAAATMAASSSSSSSSSSAEAALPEKKAAAADDGAGAKERAVSPLSVTTHQPRDADNEAHEIQGSPTSDFASLYGKSRVHREEDRVRAGTQLQPRVTSPAAGAASAAPGLSRQLSSRTRHAFLPDEEIAGHWIFGLLLWLVEWIVKPFNGFDVKGLKRLPKHDDSAPGMLFFGRHSTHNSEILTLVVDFWSTTGRVSRALFHRLLMTWLPWLKYLGGVSGQRDSAVALLQSGFCCGVIPGGTEEAMTGHENAYRVTWPSKRVGFAKVAMESGASLIPFFTRNVEESRLNPVHGLFHHLRGYVPYEYLTQKVDIPIVSSVVYTAGIFAWFITSWIAIPIPVRCTFIFGSPVPYRPDEDTEVVVARCQEALQALINEHQPNAPQGRNYMRALSERWIEWRAARPKLIRTIERLTPTPIGRYLHRWVTGGKKQK